ncbi:MAG: TonB-dependent receptor [Gammaproteobacteria bacterium]|nr:TonB-dependent receptor [Gammaproteobacteria bacterium]
MNYRTGPIALFAFVSLAPLTAEEAAVPDGDDRLEEMVVVGSRARTESRADELPVPVEVHQQFDLARTGEVDLGAALTKLAPSFNYSRLSVGDGALLHTATLRGLGPDQTLVLVNGKRRHSMAWLRVLDGVIGYGTGGTDLRAIPQAAAGRVEVLRDGAAAQYGSDAIAGVINLALKETLATETTLHAGTSPDVQGATVGLSVNSGMRLGDGGFLNWTLEAHQADSIERNGGNGGLDPDYQDQLISLSSPSHSGAAVFANAMLPLGAASELYAFGGASRREGRSSGAYRFRHGYWDGIETGDPTWDFVLPNFITFHERNAHPVYPNGFLPTEESEIDDISLTGGSRFSVRDWEVDLSAGYGRNRFNFAAASTINASIAAYYLAANPEASVAQVIANAGPRGGKSGGIDFRQASVNLDIRRDFDEGPLSAVAAGVERRGESYRQRAGDPASWSCGLPHVADFRAFAVGPDGQPLDGVVAACGFQGYPGYSPRNARLSDDSRYSMAAYVDLESRPAEGVLLGAALRAEDYSDAGAQTTGKVVGRFELTDRIALRGGVSTGFRAPSLSQRRFNSILFVASDAGLTTTLSAGEGHEVARAFGVDSLQHETAQNVSAGLVGVWAGNRLRLTADIFSTRINDRVVRSQGLGCAGIAACDAELVSTAAFFFNGVDTETTGIDFSARWGLPAAGGYLWLSANAHASETDIVGRNLPAGAPAGVGFGDYYGGWAADQLERGQPGRQANVTADFTRGRWGVVVRINHFGDTVQHPLDTGMIEVDAGNTVDAEARLDWGSLKLAAGINNLFDELPTELPKTHLSNVLWGIRYPTDTPWGLGGRFVYLRLSHGLAP